MPKLNKKELKDYINKNGFFAAATILKPAKEMSEIEQEAYMPAAVKESVPPGATYFKAIASNGELNRNGYIIRETAWPLAVENYLQNPVVLLQHDMDQPIGQVLTAHVGKDGLVISGFVFDELTNGRFSKGLFNAISTGHITEGREFENTATREVLSEEEFKRLSYEEQSKSEWVMAVTSLDWLENSIVSIGANRKSLVKNRDLVKNYIEELKNNKPEKEIETQKTVDEKVAEEKPLAEGAAVENTEALKESTNTVEVEKAELEEASNAIATLANLAVSQKEQIQSLTNEVKALRSVLQNIPMQRGKLFIQGASQVAVEKKPSQLASIFEASGIKLKA